MKSDHHPTGLIAGAIALTTVLTLIACAALPPVPATAYPQSPAGDVVDDYHGQRVADPYRSLEQLDAPATRAWIEQQNALSMPYLAKLAPRPWIKQRLTELFTYERFGVPVKEGGKYFYLRNDGQQNHAALYVTDDLAQPGRILLDPNSIRGDATVALSTFVPSPDGSKLAYALSDGGTDRKTWYVRDVQNGAELTDVITDTKFTKVSWARDASGFFYSRYPRDAAGIADDQRQPVIYFHRLGEPQAQDRQIFAVTDHATRIPDGIVTEDGRYLVIWLDNGTLSNGVSLLRLNERQDGPAPGATPQPVFDRYDGLYTFLGTHESHGVYELYFLTSGGAANGRIVALDPAKPAATRERVVVPQSPQVISSAQLMGTRLFTVYLQDAHARAVLYETDGRKAGEIPLPGLGDIGDFSGHGGDVEAFFSYSDFFTPSRVMRLDVATQALEIWRAPKLAADTRPYVTEQVFYTSRDGTRVPMFLVHKRNMPRDGRQPVLLYGYGGFNVSITPTFSAATLIWLEMGGVYAVANIRGGGEYGEAWHQAGAREKKQNVFDDFIAAAEYLIAQKITSPAHLAIDGASNGGLLVGAVLTQRPELFGAALPTVGVLDMLRYQLANANARMWADDFGLSEIPADFRAQIAYSPLHNVHPGCYPPTFIATADHDDRVVPWHSFKFAAAMQKAQQCANPVIIRVETRAGHGAGKPIWMQIDDRADRWAFLAAALKMPPPRAAIRP